MKKAIYTILLTVLAISAVSLNLDAQTTGSAKITAKIIDAGNNQTVPYATAVLLNRRTKATVKVAQTDADGNLNLSNLPSGVFTFKISYVGYQTMVRDSMQITGKDINLGTLRMKAAKGMILSEVKVTGQKSSMQLGIDKKVFSVDQSLVSEGGSATDLLQNVPSVQTDIDGNVSLRGSTGVKVLIDGKPSLIAGGNVAQILQSIPASSIESVEVITNPSAKYDAEGQSGIINIVLKKNKKLGFNGNLALTAGNRNNYNANTSLSFQNDKINVYGNYSYRYGDRFGGGFNNIQYLNSSEINPTVFADQTTDSKSNDRGHNVKAGIDFYLAPKSTLSFTGGFNIRDNTRNDMLTINQLDSSRNPVQLSNRINNNDGNGKSYDLNLDYDQKFKKPKEELTFNFGLSQGENENFQTYNTDIYNLRGVSVDQLVAQENNGQGYNTNYNIQSDYSLPVGKAGKIEAGYRSQINFSDNKTSAFILNPQTNEYDRDFSLTNAFNTKEQIHALYLNYSNQIKKFGYQIGLRGEDAALDTKSGVFNRGNALVYTPGRVAYTRLYPSIYLTEKLDNEQQLQLSYSRRVNRPRGWDVNPYIDASDPLNYRQGNPNLKPEDVHAFELGYSKYWTKVSLISSIYYRLTNDVIQRVRSEPDINGISITTPQNLTRNISSGVELISKVDVVKPWNFTANVNLYQSKIEGVPAFGIVENSGFSWNANLTNNFVLPYKVTLQVRADYRSAEVMAQGTRNAMYGVDAGAKYDFPNKKASLSLNVRDLFNTRKWSMTTQGTTSIVDFERYMQGQMGNITFSYRFGKSDFTSKKPKKTDQPEQRPDEEQF
jgi:outer membrane receptor protein involved in Fe transport